MPYSKAYKQRMVQKMTGPNAMSATALSAQEDPSQATLSRWLLEAGIVVDMANNGTRKSRKQTKTTAKARPRRPQDWSLEDKLRVLNEAALLAPDELGAYLRREGLHEAQLEQWRSAVREALEAQRARRPRRAQPTAEQKRIKELERELRRKEKALAEAAALLVLKKKAQAIWGDEDDDTTGSNGG